MRKKIGILTGNPSESGMELCRETMKQIRNIWPKDVTLEMPDIVIISEPAIGISMEMNVRIDALRSAMLAGIKKLCELGAQILVHPAHSTSYFTPEIALLVAEYGADFLSIAAATKSDLDNRSVTEITLLGTSFVTDFSQPWSAYKGALSGLKIHTPSPKGLKVVHKPAYEVQSAGHDSPKALNWLRDLLRTEVPKDCRFVVLAMTEFTDVARLLGKQGSQGKVLIDPMESYGEAVAKAWFNS